MSDKKGSNTLILKNTNTPLEKKIRGGANLLKNIIKLKKNKDKDKKGGGGMDIGKTPKKTKPVKKMMGGANMMKKPVKAMMGKSMKMKKK